jgi:hypothetical protein
MCIKKQLQALKWELWSMSWMGSVVLTADSYDELVPALDPKPDVCMAMQTSGVTSAPSSSLPILHFRTNTLNHNRLQRLHGHANVKGG